MGNGSAPRELLGSTPTNTDGAKKKLDGTHQPLSKGTTIDVTKRDTQAQQKELKHHAQDGISTAGATAQVEGPIRPQSSSGDTGSTSSKKDLNPASDAPLAQGTKDATVASTDITLKPEQDTIPTPEDAYAKSARGVITRLKEQTPPQTRSDADSSPQTLEQPEQKPIKDIQIASSEKAAPAEITPVSEEQAEEPPRLLKQRRTTITFSENLAKPTGNRRRLEKSTIAPESVEKGSSSQNDVTTSPHTDVDNEWEPRPLQRIPTDTSHPWETRELPNILERLETLEKLGEVNTASQKIIDTLYGHYQENREFLAIASHTQQDRIKIDALLSDLRKPLPERVKEITLWETKKRANNLRTKTTSQSTENADTIAAAQRGKHALARRFVKPFRAFKNLEGRKLQSKHGSVELTPLQDQEFPGRDWRQDDIKRLLEHMQERQSLLNQLKKARDARSSAPELENPAQKYSLAEKRVLDSIGTATDKYAGRDSRSGKLQPLETALKTPGQEQSIETTTLYLQNLRLVTKLSETGTDRDTVREGIRYCLYELPTSTLKLTAKHLADERRYREDPDKRGSNVTLFEKQQQYPGFSISEAQLDILQEETLLEIQARTDAEELATICKNIGTEATKNGKTSEQNESILDKLAGTATHQWDLLTDIGSPLLTDSGMVEAEFIPRMQARMIMNMSDEYGAFVWNDLYQRTKIEPASGPIVEDYGPESQISPQQYGVELIDAFPPYAIQSLLHRYHVSCVNLMRQRRKIPGTTEQEKQKIGEINTQIQHFMSFHRLVSLSSYKKLITRNEKGTIII